MARFTRLFYPKMMHIYAKNIYKPSLGFRFHYILEEIGRILYLCGGETLKETSQNLQGCTCRVHDSYLLSTANDGGAPPNV